MSNAMASLPHWVHSVLWMEPGETSATMCVITAPNVVPRRVAPNRSRAYRDGKFCAPVTSCERSAEAYVSVAGIEPATDTR